MGVEDAEERKKLYFLVQRLQKILNNKSNAEDGEKKESLSTSDKAAGDKGFGDREREDNTVVIDG